jgi:hypothetical protein
MKQPTGANIQQTTKRETALVDLETYLAAKVMKNSNYYSHF